MKQSTQLSSWCWKPPNPQRIGTDFSGQRMRIAGVQRRLPAFFHLFASKCGALNLQGSLKTRWLKGLGLSYQMRRALVALSLVGLLAPPTVLLAETACHFQENYVSYDSVTGQLQIPAIEVLNSQGQSEGFATAVLQQVPDTREGAWFELVSAAPVEGPAADAPARYEGATGHVEVNGYILGTRGEARSFHQAKLALDPETSRFQIEELTEKPFNRSGLNAPSYAGDETVFSLVRGGADQFLLPVEVGNQTLNLLVDTGSDALLVFEDRLSDCNRSVRKRSDNPIRVSDTPVSKSYASGTRQGVLATAPVRIGTYAHPSMQIMLIETPDSQNDPSLTAKGADGIIGLRHTAGLNLSNDAALLDAPMNLLSPQVGRVEFNLPPAGEATLAFGKQPLLEQADDNYVFRAKTRAIADPNDRTLQKRFADMQVPFRVKTSYGEAAEEDLDILLDTGAVSRLVLDTQVAEQLGYDSAKGEWMIDQDEEIELNLIGLTETTTLYPKFKVWEVSVAPYSMMGVEFEAVLGISRWQEYVVGFDFVSDYNGGPDGTISLLRRLDMHAISEQAIELSDEFMPLPGLNSVGNDEFPATDHSGDVIVFQSDRDGGVGGLDIYVWQRDVGLLSLPNLNTAANEMRPVISANGQLLAYESDRDGVAPIGLDIYLYDLEQQQTVDLPELNSNSEDSMSSLSGDGRYIAFVSQRDGNSDIYLYDRDNATFVELPGVNSSATESAPALSENGHYITFTQTQPTNNGQAPNEDIRFYNIQTKTLLPLSKGIQGVNTLFNEQQPALLGNQRLAFHSNRRNPEMGLYNRDLFVIDMITQIPTAQIGLNSDFDDIMPRFSGDGRLLVFQSRRPGGLGGADIYLYSLDSQADNTATAELPPQDIAFKPTDAGLFTAPISVDEQNLNLLVDTHFNALLVFQERAADLVGSDAVTVNFGNSQVNGTLAIAQVVLGQHQASAMRIVLADRTEVETVLGISTGNADGILGLAWQPHLPAGVPPLEGPPPGPPPAEGPPANLPDVPLQSLQPAVNLLEINFGAQAGLTLNRLPVTGDNERAQHTAMSGVGGANGGYTELRIPVTFIAYGADNAEPLHTFGIPRGPQAEARQLPRAALSSLYTDQIILDRTVAEALGYDSATQSWGLVERLDLSFLFIGADALLPIADKISVNQIQVTDFSTQDYQIVLGSHYWNRYILGIDYLSNGSGAMLFLADSADSSTVEHSIELAGDQFIPLPGVNTIADEEFGTISADGQTIAFYSNRRNGHSDIYVWRVEEGLLDLPNLNSDDIDRNPSLNGDGTLLAFESTRNGQTDIMLYDLSNREFIDLPNLNTDFPEEQPMLSADGSQLAYMSIRDDVHKGSPDIYIYDINKQQAIPVYSAWLNTQGDEMEPTLNADGSLLAFSGGKRSDGFGGNDVYVQRQGRLQTLPHLNTQFMDTAPALSADGHFLAFFSDRYEPNRGHLGNDIFLMELSSGELLDLPGLNSDYEDTSPALTEDSEYILFQSKRPGGEGGYDLYLYHRDTEDETRYVVSKAYLEEGYVTDARGRSQANATVQVTDGDGNLIGTTETDSAGHFTLSIPAGVVLPLAYVSDDSTVVIDEVGDDTYIPDFEAGNLKFTEVWVEDTLQASMPTKIWFDVETETPKYNTFVKLYLVELSTGSIDEIDVSGGDFKVAHTLTALSIEQLGQVGPGEMVTETQGQDIKTETSYLTEDNRKAHVEHSFIVPATVEDGTYAVVFSIGRFDYHPEDDALQSEDLADRDDNFLAAPATVIIGQPNKPNLRILSAELNSNSFELPNKRPEEGSTQFGSELTLNMEVESMAQDAELPVDITFALEVDGQSYPLVLADNQGSRPSQIDVKTYPVTCREETRDGYPEGERCASLFRQEQTGYTYKLYIGETAYDALAAKTADTVVDLVIQLDPKATIDEWENNTADNVKVMPVMFLVSQVRTRRATRSSGSYLDNVANVMNDMDTNGWVVTDYSSYDDGSKMFGFNEDDLYGSDDFGAGYAFNAQLTYAEGELNGTSYPYAASFDGMGNAVYVNIFGVQFDFLEVDAAADINGDKIICSWFGYDVDIITGKTYEGFYSILDDPFVEACYPDGEGGDSNYTATEELELWSSQDEDGNELYTVSRSQDYEKTFTIGGVPITVAAGATGDLGIRGDVTIDTNNTLDIEVGPYLELTGYAEGGVGTSGFSAGVGIELLILGVDLPFHATLKVKPSYPLAVFTFEAPLIISTLDGKFYLYVKTFLDKYTYTIVKWDGLEWEYALIDPIYMVWAEDDQFVYVKVDNNAPSGIDDLISVLNYDWGSQNAFTAKWQGNFTFDADTYTFVLETDDYATLKMDSDKLLVLDNREAIDSAGFDDTGTLTNGASIWTSDALSAATSGSGYVNLEGGDDYIHLSKDPIPSQVGTIEHWVKPHNIDENSILVYTGDNKNGTYNGFGHSKKNSTEIHTGIKEGKAYFTFKHHDNSTNSEITGSTALSVNTWYHIAVTYNYEGDATLYVNGTEEGSVSISDKNYDFVDGDNSYIGRAIDDTLYFDGNLDEVRIWNDVRTEEDIQYNMNRQLNGDEEGLVAYYRFDSAYAGASTVNVDISEEDTLSLEVDYENSSAQADLSLYWYQPSDPGNFNVFYYDNTSWSGIPAWSDIEDKIDHNWGAGMPGDNDDGSENSYGLSGNTFSAMWEGEFDLTKLTSTEQSYVFMVTTDDENVRLYLGNNTNSESLTAITDTDMYYVVVDDLSTSSLNDDSLYDIKLEYSHSTDDAAMIKLAWMPADQWLLTPFEPDDNGGWKPFEQGSPRITSDINEAGEHSQGRKDAFWDYSGFFNFGTAGMYDFIVRADDGIKLYVDNHEYLGHWSIDEATAYIVPITLDAGYHLITVEHYDQTPDSNGGNNYLVREINWSQRQNNEFIGFYYSTQDDMNNDDPWDADNYDGTEPLLISKNATSEYVTGCTFTTTSLDCDWDRSSPVANLTGVDPSYLNTDNFGVRWIGDFDFSEGVYVFTAKADDGLKLWVDDVSLLETDDYRVTYQEAVVMLSDDDTGDSHNLRIEYWEDVGDTGVELSWTEISQDTFNVQYFDSSDFTGTPTDGGTVSTIDYNSGADSARWVGVFDFEEVDYTFTVNTDGGVRVYVDGKAIIDEWAAQSSITEYTATVALEEGLHSLKVEYFEGNSGSPAIDVSWLGTSEIAGNALSFDGTDDYMVITNATSENFTLEAWIKPNGTATNDGANAYRGDGLLWSDINGTADDFVLAVQGDYLSFWEGNAEVNITSNTVVTDGWHHIAVTRESKGSVILYVDGVEDNSVSISDATGAALIANPIINVGANGSRYYSGQMDELRIWNTVRSQAEIQAWMKSTLSGDESNLVAYYQFDFDQSSTTTATDTTGSYNGTLNGDPQWVTSDALLTELPPPGSALSFDGTDDYVEITNATSENFTLEAWINTAVTASAVGSNAHHGDGLLWSDVNGDANDFVLAVLGDKLSFWDGNAFTNVTGSTSITDGNWHHIAVSRTSGGVITLYVDGIEDGSGSAGSGSLTDNPVIHIGANTLSSRHYSGQIDEVRIWNVPRSQAEIQAYMNRTLDGDESGLVAYYTFDEPAGFTETTLTNTVGSYDGTLKGNPTWVTSGATLSKMVAPGNAMSFDGSDDYVAITNTTSEDFTLEAWIKPDGTGSAAGSNAFHGDGILWSDVSGSANDFVLAILGNNIAFWDGSADANGTGGNVTGNTDVVTDGEWHHIAVTRESGGSMILYVDGVPDGSATAGTNALTDNPAIHIGANTLNSRYYSGQIDEVRIWNTARSQTEIQADMYRALDSFESGLAAYYRFDQDSGTELVDVTSFDNDGTLNGSPTWVTSEVPMD